MGHRREIKLNISILYNGCNHSFLYDQKLIGIVDASVILCRDAMFCQRTSSTALSHLHQTRHLPHEMV